MSQFVSTKLQFERLVSDFGGPQIYIYIHAYKDLYISIQ